MGLDLASLSTASQLNFAREDVEAVQRLRQNYPSHILSSLFEGVENKNLTVRESVSSYSSGSTRSSVSSSPRHHKPTASYTSSIPSISERSESPDMYRQNVGLGIGLRPKPLVRSVSDYNLRDHAIGLRSFPQQQIFTSNPVYFCVHCGNGFEQRADWETHEWIFHERQSYWLCPNPGCEAVFDSGKSFEAHHEAMHGCVKCNHATEIVRLLPERKAWACGFDGCKGMFLDWSKRCKHVASHYEGLARRHGSVRDTPEWTYATMIRNLLRQPEVRDLFKRFMTKCHGHSKTGWPKLDWQRDNTGELRRCLEYRDFRRGIPDIIHLAYRLGHPAYTAAVQVMSRPPTPPAEEINQSHSRSRAQSDSSVTSPSLPVISPSSPASQSRPLRSYLYERKPSLSTLPELHATPAETKHFRLARSLPSSPPTLSPPHTRNTSPIRAPSIASTETSQSTQSRPIPRKRMIAREPEVRGTSCTALIGFLRQGPPGSIQGEMHRARRVPSPRPPNSPTPDFKAKQFSEHETREDQIRETVLEIRQPSQMPLGVQVLPPTPGPPPTQALPDPPAISRSNSSSSSRVPELVLTLNSDPSASFNAPPSPMPPGFTDMQWPLPPPSAPQRPRTATCGIRQEVPKLMAPPKRARSASRSRGRTRTRWVSISSIIDPPMPSPGDVDFESCFTQPLDLVQPAVIASS